MTGLLELLQLADSALPVGAVAHSFGLETLAEEQSIDPENLAQFLHDHLAEAGALDAAFVRRAWRAEDPAALSREYAARRPSRESREAAYKIGRRFAELFSAISGERLPAGIPYPIAFGIAGSRIGAPEESVVFAYLQQSMTGLISACQRLLPLGQIAASRILWNLRPAIREAAARSENMEVWCFQPLPELGSMRHSSLETRLFIS